MKTTRFLKRIFASLITVAIATTFATVSLNQAAFAEDISLEGSVSSTYTGITITNDSDGDSVDFVDNLDVVINWKSTRMYAYAIQNSISVGSFTGNISIEDVYVSNSSSSISNAYLYALYNNSDGIIENITGSVITVESVVFSYNESSSYGIYNEGVIDSIDGETSISVSGAGSKTYGIYNTDTGTITNISNMSIVSTSTNNEARAIANMGGVIDNISWVEITSNQEGSNSATGIYNSDTASIGSISDLTITATSVSSEACAISNQGSIDSISNATLNAFSTSGTAYGISIENYNTNDSITNISAVNITATTAGDAYGIYSKNGIIGDLSGMIQATSTEGDATGFAISGGSVTGAITATMTATATNGNAYGLYIASSSTVSGDIAATIEASGGTESYAIYNTSGNASNLNFSGDTTLSATGGSTANYAIYSDAALYSYEYSDDNMSASMLVKEYENGWYTWEEFESQAERCGITTTKTAIDLTLTSVDADGNAANATVTMTGDIYSSASIIVDSGNYVLAGDRTTITATSMSISSGVSLTLNADTTLNITDGGLSNYGTITGEISGTITTSTGNAIENYSGASIDSINNLTIEMSDGSWSYGIYNVYSEINSISNVTMNLSDVNYGIVNRDNSTIGSISGVTIEVSGGDSGIENDMISEIGSISDVTIEMSDGYWGIVNRESSTIGSISGVTIEMSGGDIGIYNEMSSTISSILDVTIIKLAVDNVRIHYFAPE